MVELSLGGPMALIDPSTMIEGYRRIADRIGRSERWCRKAAYDWPPDERMPLRRLGGTVFVVQDELNEWLDRVSRKARRL